MDKGVSLSSDLEETEFGPGSEFAVMPNLLYCFVNEQDDRSSFLARR